ncbi:glycosyltransferase family 4 protein [Geobacter argillaceus]|uniref:Glycosyltransferase involved in cell wall biosynthesis n=1 Tax=Geobacter argillaceus TaxID=345631 RepID=A0A562V640_9BACT|nr:glycosyltransferase family 1 protein [Geobacter argillaceus]TWJ13379.1 glycosyltransferase involved in cell wall biosynthesis [Geobacter argillaceus]
MQVGLNAISLYPGAIGGMETYFRKLLQWLQVIDHGNDYTLICNSSHKGEFPLVNARFSSIGFTYEQGSFNWFIRGVLRNALGLDPLRGRFNRLGCDVIHHPFNVLNPLQLKVPAVLTVNDIQHEYYPEFFTSAQLYKRKAVFRPSVEEAARIITISEFTKQCIVEKYGVTSGKIDVIHIGCGEEYRPISDVAALAAVRKRYGLERPFMFYPAATWPHKNHATLLKAIKLLRDRHAFDGELVLSGIAMQSHSKILAEVESLGLSGAVRVLGYLPYEELPYIYNLAVMMVFPSRFEGFGIPIVEAMASGCPVVCSNVTSLPEVAGDATELFDPSSVEEMAEKIRLVWESEDIRAALRLKGIERSGLFAWDEIARKTLAVYGKACR